MSLETAAGFCTRGACGTFANPAMPDEPEVQDRKALTPDATTMAGEREIAQHCAGGRPLGNRQAKMRAGGASANSDPRQARAGRDGPVYRAGSVRSKSRRAGDLPTTLKPTPNSSSSREARIAASLSPPILSAIPPPGR